MRIAVVSDIHGNLPALEAVLADIASLGVDLTINLGDILSGPLWPFETAQRLMPLQLPTISGNHERQVLTQPLDRQSATDAHTSRAIGAPERDWLSALPTALEPVAGVRCCHGTPHSDLHYLLETVTDDFGLGGSRGLRAATRQEVLDRLGPGFFADGARPAVLLCGHSHVPRVVDVAGCLIVNPGSVGLPAFDDAHPHAHWVENGTPQARWACLEQAQPGEAWHADLRTCDYDWGAAAARAEAHHRGDWADALRTGRVGRTEAQAMRLALETATTLPGLGT